MSWKGILAAAILALAPAAAVKVLGPETVRSHPLSSLLIVGVWAAGTALFAFVGKVWKEECGEPCVNSPLGSLAVDNCYRVGNDEGERYTSGLGEFTSPLLRRAGCLTDLHVALHGPVGQEIDVSSCHTPSTSFPLVRPQS
jgi:hypothetical protein